MVQEEPLWFLPKLLWFLIKILWFLIKESHLCRFDALCICAATGTRETAHVLPLLLKQTGLIAIESVELLWFRRN